MSEMAEFVHYLIVALIIGINSIAVGIGEGLASASAVAAINRQPKAASEIRNCSVLGMALIETAAIIGVTISIIILGGSAEKTLYFGIAEIGIALAICFAGFAIGLSSAWPAKKACMAIARQPFASKKIIQFMLITQTIIQTPIIFGFIIALFIKMQASSADSVADGLRLLASGLAIGLGSVGPVIGLSEFGGAACEGIGVNKKSYTKILSFTFVSEAIIETPVIFALVVAFGLLFLVPKTDNIVTGVAYLASAICIGLGTLGPGISSGRTASAAARQIALKPEHYSIISRVSMFGQGLIDTSAIYALVVSFALMWFAK